MKKIINSGITVIMLVLALFLLIRIYSMSNEIKFLKTTNMDVNKAYMKQLGYKKLEKVKRKEIQEQLDGLKIKYDEAQVAIVDFKKKIKGTAKKNEEKKRYEVETKYIKGWFDNFGNYDLNLKLEIKMTTIKDENGIIYVKTDNGKIKTKIVYVKNKKQWNLKAGFLSPNIALTQLHFKTYNFSIGVDTKLKLHYGFLIDILTF